ncbi:uncharacterized protein LOC127864553 isoform X2 [Dreissena polymorpha]|uniref:uncharacterized protein LOC127864553 isoform X2 n=1 Tax=Dreissena polymorpha TaxID=45954 RepID=UPI0022643379|nr:uncharacterized protein LOC127864553 isoform X2 [Dreissena polymorpha]
MQHKDCPCLQPFRFHCIPKDEDMRMAWIKSINRKDLKFKPSSKSLVCSLHFLDGRPTNQNPIPVVNMGMTRTQKSPVLATSKKYKRRKVEAERNTMESDTGSESAIIKTFYSTTQTSGNTLSARLSGKTLKSDQTLDNSVCVKVETDEWYNTAAGFYSASAKLEQVQGDEIHSDCNKQDGFNLIHEQTGCLRLDQDYTKQAGFTTECVKSEQTECEVMHQDVTRQACVNYVCVNTKTTINSNANTAHDELHSVCGKKKQSLNPNTDRIYITTNSFKSVCGKAKQDINTDTVNENTFRTANDHNSLCGKRIWTYHSATPDILNVQTAHSSGSRSCSLLPNMMTVYSADQHLPIPINSSLHANESACTSNVKTDVSKEADDRLLLQSWYALPSENHIHTIERRVIDDTTSSLNSKSNLSQNITESQSNGMPLSVSFNMEEFAVTPEVNSNLAAESVESSGIFVEIFIERNKRKSEIYQPTYPSPKRVRCQGSSRGIVQPRMPSARDNAVTRTDCIDLKSAKIKLDAEGVRVKKVKRMKEAKTQEKVTTDFSLQERNHASCMNKEPRDNDHFLYCGECNKDFKGDCPAHGPYNYIQDKEVPEGDPLKADHTLPDCLDIKSSKIVGAGLGVFSKVALESRIMFGPYEGDIITVNQKSGYCWQVYKEGKASHFVDAQNKATSNWMRYVNCAMKEADKNIVAFQYKGGIYYCTLKPISSGEELLVWYGDEFARELGLIRDDNLCSYSSKSSGHLKTRTKKHTGERQLKRELCGETFKQSGHLTDHMRIHTEERPFKCEVCGNAFNESGGLKKHTRIHTGERPFKCEVCGEAFKQSGHLTSHIRIHTEERPFKCEVCGEAFKQSGHLKDHMRIHAEERPYKCEVCGYAFKMSRHLTRHVKKHTGER